MREGMKNQDVYDLMDRFEKSGIARMKFESGDTSLELEKTIAVSGAPAVAAAPMAQPAVCGVEAASAQEPEAGPFIKAPMVGTFYVASSPDAQPWRCCARRGYGVHARSHEDDERGVGALRLHYRRAARCGWRACLVRSAFDSLSRELG